MAAKSSGQSIVYVHGTNGSGKSTLARYLIMCAGGIKVIRAHPVTGAMVTYTHSRLALVGKYRTPTGGADSVQPYALVPKTAVALLRDGHHVFVEGLMSPGIDTCTTLANNAKKLGANMRFIRLDIGFYKSCQNVERRRMLTGNDKPFDPINLRKKQQSCNNWLENLAAAGLPIWGFNWEQTRDFCLSAYNLKPSGAIHVLDE